MVTDFKKEVEGLSKEFFNNLQVKGDELTKAFETIQSSLTAVDTRLSSKINAVEAKVISKAVGMAKEIVAATAITEVTKNFTTHLKDYVSMFFKSVLDNEDVALFSELHAM